MDNTKHNKQPSFGILVNKFSTSSYNKMSKRIRFLIEANKKKELTLFFFTLDDLNLEAQMIRGKYWDYTSKRWREQNFKIPNYICCRSGFNRERPPKALELRDMVYQNGGKVFNMNRFDKWEVHEKLSKHKEITGYLPQTKVYSGKLGALKMLDDYKTVYLKPTQGSKGLYVMRLEDKGKMGYRYSYFDHRKRGGKLELGKIKTKKDLGSKVRDFYKGKRFIVQKGIKLILHQGRLVDMRAEVQRNGNGDIEIAGIAARLGGLKSPITTHSDAIKLKEFFSNVLGYDKGRVSTIFTDIEDFLIKIYQAIEAEFGDYADIGIDFAVDKNDRIWYIECNSRSAKVSFAKTYDAESVEKSYTSILDYVKHLSEVKN